MQYIYSALLLHKLGKPIDEEGIKKVLEAAGDEIDEAKIKTLIASLKGVDIEKALEEAVIAPAIAEKEKEKPAAQEEEKKEVAAEGLAALFG